MEELDVNTYYPIGTVGLVNYRRVIVQVSSVVHCLSCTFRGNHCLNAVCRPRHRKDNLYVTFKLLN